MRGVAGDGSDTWTRVVVRSRTRTRSRWCSLRFELAERGVTPGAARRASSMAALILALYGASGARHRDG